MRHFLGETPVASEGNSSVNQGRSTDTLSGTVLMKWEEIGEDAVGKVFVVVIVLLMVLWFFLSSVSFCCCC